VCDLGADLLERTRRFRGDLAPRLLEAALPFGLRLLAHSVLHRHRRLPRIGEDLLGVASRLVHELAVLLEQLAGLVACVLRIPDRAANLFAALVEHLLDRTERDALQRVERDEEADDRPDHQARRNRDERVSAEHQTSTYARIEPSRP